MSKLMYARGDVIAGRYEVVDHLGENPLGVVYRVKHLEAGRYLRLTLLRPDIASPGDRDRVVEAFERARAADHDGLLQVGELAEAEGVAFFTSEDVEGSTLRELLDERRLHGGQVDLRLAAQVASRILDALEQVHRQGSVYRALRPEYVLVQVRTTGPSRMDLVSEVKLYGAFLFDLVPTTALVEDEFTRGEAQYLAPELKAREPSATPLSDVYSVGVVLYEMLVGNPPVGTFQLPSAVRPDLPKHLNDVVELALALAPEDRYPSAAAFREDLKRAFDEAGAFDTPDTSAVSPLFWAVALVCVVLVGVLAYAARPDPVKQAIAADSKVRAEVYEQHARPSDAEIASVLSRHPPNMIFVPGGPFVRGRLHVEKNGQLAPATEPVAEVVEVEGFLIDAFEYPNLKGGKPMVRMTADEAEAACAAEGKRLCTAEEWEKACKGPANTIYSWGDDWDVAPCGEGLEDTSRSGARPDCRSGWGVFDISGNFREWTATAPKGKSNRRIVKGGLKGNAEKGMRCAMTTDLRADYKDSTLSFRCCRDLDAPPVEPEPAE